MKKFKFIKIVCIISMISLILTACGSNATTSTDNKTQGNQKEITVTDVVGRKVKLKAPVNKVVLTFNFEEYMTVAGKEGFKKIVGWSRDYWKGRRQDVWKEFTEAYPELKKIPDVGYTVKKTFSVEKIITLKPDVVLMCANDYENNKTNIEKLNQAGIPVVFVNYHSQKTEDYTASTLLLGKVLGKEQRAKEVVAFYKNQVDKVYSKLKNIKKAEPKVYIELGTKGGSSTYGDSYGDIMWGALIKNCRAKNIAIDKVKKMGPLSREYILSQNPETIIITGLSSNGNKNKLNLGYEGDKKDTKDTLNKYIKRSGWNKLNAVKNKKVYGIYHDFSRHIFDFAGLQYCAKAIYPEEFKDLNPEENLKEFYEKFYPLKLKGQWMVGVEK
ncbi:ABC transporter substrate-binding protein [Clostridium botulinum]|nr:ABC transporter substrate-binding protein [Clostridium botulinum]